MYKFTPQDMDQLCSNGGQWGLWAKAQEGRFDVMGAPYGTEPNYDFKYAHWLDDNWANVILAKMFLEQEGFTYQVLWDNADNTADWWFDRVTALAAKISPENREDVRELAEMLRRPNYGYVILTDYDRRGQHD